MIHTLNDISNEYVICKYDINRDDLDTFQCSDDDFTEYLKITAEYDQKSKFGQTWLFTLNEEIVGFITLAMSYAKKGFQIPKLDTYGNIPALLISHLATYKDHKKKELEAIW